LIQGRAIGTKKGYATCVTQFLRFCAQNNEDVYIGTQLNPWAVMYWLHHKAWVAGSANSHKTWTGALNWLCAALDLDSVHLDNRHVRQSWSEVKVALMKQQQQKDMLTVKHICTYIRQHLQVDPHNLRQARYDALVEALYLTLTFVTASRSAEIVYADKTDRSDKDRPIVKITGLRWSDITIRQKADEDGFRSPLILEVRVRFFKNQTDKKVPKLITIASPQCEHFRTGCSCDCFNLIGMISVIHAMRRQRRRNPAPFTVSKRGPPAFAKDENLNVGPEDFLFVNARGTIIKYPQLAVMFRRLSEVNGCEEAGERITVYSSRVGATSLAHHQGVDALAMMRFVEWKPIKASPTMHSHYVQYTRQQLSAIPFQMLHGAYNTGPPSNCIEEIPQRFELRDEVIISEVYSGTSLKKASRKLPRKLPVFRFPVPDTPEDQ
jgi:hypothetical protein